MAPRPGPWFGSRRSAGWRLAAAMHWPRTCGLCCGSGPRRSGARAGYGGAKRKRGFKLHLADDRAEVGRLAQAVRASTGQGVGVACVEGGRTGPKAADAAGAHGLELEVARLLDARRGFVLLPRRWVVERLFAWPPAFAGW